MNQGTQGGALLPVSSLAKLPLPKFSVYRAGAHDRNGNAVLAKTPCGVMDLYSLYSFITTNKQVGFVTKELRRIKDHKEAQQFKLENFSIATVTGIFSKRNGKGLAQATGYMILDIDDLKDKGEVGDVRYICINDKRINPLLVFTSPGGHGVKVVIYIDPANGLGYRDYYKQICRYMTFEHGIEVDQSGSDICRACYLPHDLDCFINTNLITKIYNHE